MCGGYDQSEGQSSHLCYRYDLTSDSWNTTSIGPLPAEHDFWGAAACWHSNYDRLYIIGGHNKQENDRVSGSIDLA